MVEAYNQHAYYMDLCSSSPSFSHYFLDTRIHHSPFARSPSVRWGHRKLCPVAKLDNVACGNRTRLTISASPFATPCHSFIITMARGKIRCLRFLTFGTISSYDGNTVGCSQVIPNIFPSRFCGVAQLAHTNQQMLITLP